MVENKGFPERAAKLTPTSKILFQNCLEMDHLLSVPCSFFMFQFIFTLVAILWKPESQLSNAYESIIRRTLVRNMLI